MDVQCSLLLAAYRAKIIATLTLCVNMMKTTLQDVVSQLLSTVYVSMKNYSVIYTHVRITSSAVVALI